MKKSTLWIIFLILSIVGIVVGFILIGLEIAFGMALSFLICPILAIFSFIMFGKASDAEEKLKTSEQKEAEALNDPKIIRAVIKSLKNSYKEECHCLICGSKMTVDKNYILSEFVRDRETIEGTYVARVSTGEARAVWQWKEGYKDFPARHISCPKCEYELWFGEIATYESSGYFDPKAEEWVGNAAYEYCKKNRYAFKLGKISPIAYGKAVEEFKHSIIEPSAFKKN